MYYAHNRASRVRVGAAGDPWQRVFLFYTGPASPWFTTCSRLLRAAGPASTARQISVSEGQRHLRVRNSCVTVAPRNVLVYQGPAKAKRLLLKWRALPPYAGSLLARESTVRGVVGRLRCHEKVSVRRAQGALGSHTPCEPVSRGMSCLLQQGVRLKRVVARSQQRCQ